MAGFAKVRQAAFLFLCLIPLACAGAGTGQGRRIFPEATWYKIVWSPEEKAKEIAVRNLWETSEASAHAVRVRTAEKPHVHDHHDLVVFMLSGKARLHLGGRVETVYAGDVMEIPRGTPHWAENLGPWASEVYAIYTPAYDGADMRPVES